jgi:hypothetical protein
VARDPSPRRSSAELERRGHLRLQLSVLRREQGRVGEVEELVRRSAKDNPTYLIWRCALANVLVEVAGPTRCAASSKHSLRTTSVASVHEEWEVSMCLLADAVATYRELGMDSHSLRAARLRERPPTGGAA